MPAIWLAVITSAPVPTSPLRSALSVGRREPVRRSLAGGAAGYVIYNARGEPMTWTLRIETAPDHIEPCFNEDPLRSGHATPYRPT